MKTGFWSKIQKVFPFAGLIVILITFTILAGDKMWTANNLQNVLNIMIPICLGGAGMVFVAAQGSTNMSMGSTLAFSATFAGLASNAWGSWVFVPVALLLGLAIGLFNGVMVAKFKVTSLMVTLAMLIALRAVVSFITNGQAVFLSPQVLVFNKPYIKLPVFIIVMALMWYLFEYTKAGFYSRCIGENEEVGRFAGIQVGRYKILVFVLAGIMSGLVGIFQVGSIGGVSPNMGSFFELQIMTAMFVGGIPVSGGASSKFYKLIVGSLMLAFLQNGLTLTRVSSEISELIQGLILLGVVFFGIFTQEKYLQRQTALAAKES